MSEKEMFLNSYEREFGITLAFLNAYPKEKLLFRPHPTLQSAQDLAWSFPEEDRVLVGGALDGDVVFKQNSIPETIDAIIAIYEQNHRQLVQRINTISDDAFNEMIIFGSGSDRTTAMRRGDVLWLALTDCAHHRGQFSVYIRMTGGNVPPLYESYQASAHTSSS